MLCGLEVEVAGGGDELVGVMVDRGMWAGGVHPYHCDCGYCEQHPHRSNAWCVQVDPTVDVEVISKPLDWNSGEASDAIHDLAAAMMAARAFPDTNAGNHVHVERRWLDDADHDAMHYLHRIFLRYQDHELEQVAQGCEGRVRGYNRRCTPSAYDHQSQQRRDNLWWSDVPDVTRGLAGRWLEDGKSHTVEFRLWNATRTAWRMHLHAGLSVAMVTAAVAGVRVEEDDPRSLADVIGPYADSTTLDLLERQLAYAGKEAA
jgi:hypothetical protein